MKKRILAAVLAAATAFSMFGASLSASAYIDEDTGYYVPYDAEEATTFLNDVAVDEADTAAELKADMEKLQKINTDATFSTIVDGVVYVADYNYEPADRTALVGALEKTFEAYEAALAKIGKGNLANISDEKTAIENALVTLKAEYAKVVKTAMSGVVTVGGNAARVNAYNRLLEAKEVLASVTKNVLGNDFTKYDVKTLKANINAVVKANGKKYLTSELIDLADSYDALNDYFGFSTQVEEAYAKELEKYLAYEASDYKASDWEEVQGKINAAVALADEGKFSEAINKLHEIDGITPKTADKTDLRAAIKDLYVSTIYYIPAEYPTADKTKAKYLAEDFKASEYTVAGKKYYVTYEYLEFAIGVPVVKNNGKEALDPSYYEAAVAVLNNDKATQSQVDKALADLEDAVAALEITNLAEEWEIIRLESSLDTATARFVDGDYRNNTAWKKLVAAIEDAEAVLAKTYPGKNEVNSAYTELQAFLAAEPDAAHTLVANSVTSLKVDLRNLVREAQTLLKDTTDKPAAVVLALEKAVTTANNTMDAAKTAQLISKYDAAISTLTDAIDGYIKGIVPDVVTGWYYSDEAKAWFFYKEDGTEMTGWMWDASYNGWYYFREDGTMVEDCSKMIGGTWYYFYKGGKMAASAWAKGLDGKWYYYNASGAMATSSWILSSGKYYYVGSDGAMLVNTTTPDGYKVDANGVWVQ